MILVMQIFKIIYYIPCRSFFRFHPEKGANILFIVLLQKNNRFIFSDSLQVAVYATPSIAGVIVGDANVCQNTQHTYSTTVQEGEWCAGYVAGELQSSTDTFMVYTFGNPGDYLIEVYAGNNCGTSNQARTLMVTAFEPPVVYLGNDTTIYEGQSITLDVGSLLKTPVSKFNNYRLRTCPEKQFIKGRATGKSICPEAASIF